MPFRRRSPAGPDEATPHACCLVSRLGCEAFIASRPLLCVPFLYLQTGKSSPEARCIFSERALVSSATEVGDLPATALLAVHITHANNAHP